MGKMSRDKGKRGERYVCHAFKDYGYEVNRTAQYRGNTGQAGDVENIRGIHAEVKFQEKMRLYDWMAQAVNDSVAEGKNNLPTVFHKQNNKDLLVTMRFSDWIQIYREWECGLPREKEDKQLEGQLSFGGIDDE